MEPVKLLFMSCRFLTLPLYMCVITPSHSPNGLLLSHLSLRVQFAPPVLLYSATSAALSPALGGVGTGVGVAAGNRCKRERAGVAVGSSVGTVVSVGSGLGVACWRVGGSGGVGVVVGSGVGAVVAVCSGVDIGVAC